MLGTKYMKQLIAILLLAFSLSAYAVDVDLLKQSLVGTWHSSYSNDIDDPRQLDFYLEGNNLMVRYVADYSISSDNNKVFHEFGVCSVKVNYDGTIKFGLKRTGSGFDRRDHEIWREYEEHSYKLFFVDGQLVGSETWEQKSYLCQPVNERGCVRFKTIEQAKRRGKVSAFPFGDEPFSTQVNFCNSDKTNIERFYKNGEIDELSNCNPKDYKFGFLIGSWCYEDGYRRLNERMRYGNDDFRIKIFVRDGNYYIKYISFDNARGDRESDVVQIFPNDYSGEVSFSFTTKQKFIGKCEEYEWPWTYVFKFDVKKYDNEYLVGTRETTETSGPIKACDIPEPEYCDNVIYHKFR